MTTASDMRSALALCLAASVACGAIGCARVAERPTPATRSAEPTSAPASAVKSANAVDIAAAKETALAYVDALKSQDASAAAELMTSYRRAEVRKKGWKAENAWWKGAQVRAVMHPGRYVADERAFAELYAEHFGHPPYKLVVVNVSYGLGPGKPPADTDFVVTRDTAGSPWLVHDFGGALRPEPPSPATP